LNQRIYRLPPGFMISSALSPQTWPFSLEWLPASACLVGGSVRDALLERMSDYLDLDFVLPEGAVETARAIAKHYKAGFVLLDAERQIARVVFGQGTADFAQQVGPTLEADLWRRDFTVNAIAYNPHTRELVDPLRGCLDLQRGIIRMVGADNLAEDPLRLLRAYRQAAQLGFALDPQTQEVIQGLAPQLGDIAAERVQSELNYLLSNPKGTVWLRAAWRDGLLQRWLPSIAVQGLDRLQAVDQIAMGLKQTWRALAQELFRNIRQSGKPGQSALEAPASGATRTWVTLTKLACLLPSDPGAAEAQLWSLKYSRAEIQAIGVLLRFLPQLLARPVSGWALGEQYQFFQAVGPVFPALVLMAQATDRANGLANVLPIGDPAEATPLVTMAHRFLDASDPVAHPQPLLTGQDLMVALKIPPSPQVGRLLAELQLARAEGRVADREEALALAADLVSQGH
jgi:tRNA nucleotidyltransferase (CCA-adding enzyme)